MAAVYTLARLYHSMPVAQWYTPWQGIVTVVYTLERLYVVDGIAFTYCSVELGNITLVPGPVGCALPVRPFMPGHEALLREFLPA